MQIKTQNSKLKIIILGSGESGTGAAILAKKLGHKTFVSDRNKIKDKYKKELIKRNIEFEEKKHTEKRILNADLIIKSPGIPDKAEIIQEIKKKGIKIIDEIEFAFLNTDAKIIAITGSNGKTTTALWLYDILIRAKKKVILAGNVGKSFAWQVAEKEFDFVVLEISSFQLDYCFEFKPYIAIILNITPDHLDRYDNSFEKYTESKFRITKNLDNNNYLIINQDDKTIKNYINKQITMKNSTNFLSFSNQEDTENGATVDEKFLRVKIKNKLKLQAEKKEIALKGKHNEYNSMSAGISACLLNIRKETIRESLLEFAGVEHRLEYFMSMKGIKFINDSKATNINSTWFALESINDPIIWIVGGQDKGNNYEELKTLVHQKVKKIICLGKDNSKIIDFFKDKFNDIEETESMKEAVEIAYNTAKSNEVVLLSPACASFDLFENYEDRGEQFKKYAREL